MHHIARCRVNIHFGRACRNWACCKPANDWARPLWPSRLLARGVLSTVTLDPANFPDRIPSRRCRASTPKIIRAIWSYIERFKTYAKSRGWNPAHAGQCLGAAPRTAHHSHSRHAHGGASGGMCRGFVASRLTAADMARDRENPPRRLGHGNRYPEEQQKPSELYC